MLDYDSRDRDPRERDDGVREWEEDWVVLGRGSNSVTLRGEEPNREPRDRDEERRAERDRDSPEDLRASIDPRDVISRRRSCGTSSSSVMCELAVTNW